MFLKAQELSIPKRKKSRQEGNRPAEMSGDLVKLKGKKEKHRQWKYGHLS